MTLSELNMDTTWNSVITLFLHIFMLLPSNYICVQDPVKITSLTTSVYPDGTRNLTLKYTSTQDVQIFWLVNKGLNKGFGLKHIEPTAEVRNTYNKPLGVSTVVLPPGNVTFDTLAIHIACQQHLYELHMDVTSPNHWTNQILEVQPYSFYAPPSGEVGITPEGLSQFHVSVDTTASSFTFGIFIGNLYTMIRDTTVPYVHEETTYSFLPTALTGSLRITKQVRNASHYNADVSIDLPELAQNGGIVSLLAVCEGNNPLIERMYIRRTLHFLPGGSKNAMPTNTVAFVNRNNPSTVSVAPMDPAIIRCMALGNPIPRVELFKKTVGGEIPVNELPSLQMTFPYQTSMVFSLLDVNSTSAGIYVCKARSGTGIAERSTTVNLEI